MPLQSTDNDNGSLAERVRRVIDGDRDLFDALAEELGYDKGVVSRDLQKLARIDVIEYVEEGRSKAPRLKHDHVAIEPVV